MIVYWKGFSGAKLLFQIHGSALYRSTFPGLLSTSLYYLFLKYTTFGTGGEFGHPYAIGVLISAVVLILVFRANHGYQRYWEACGGLHMFMSKLLDASVHMAVFHFQSMDLEGMKPISIFEIQRSHMAEDEDEDDKSVIKRNHRRVFSGDWSINEVSEDYNKDRSGGKGFDIGSSMRDIFGGGGDDKPRSRAGSKDLLFNNISLKDIFGGDTPRTARSRAGSKDSSFGGEDFPNRARAATDPMKRSRHRKNIPPFDITYNINDLPETSDPIQYGNIPPPFDITYNINDIDIPMDLPNRVVSNDIPTPKIKGHRRLQSTPESNHDIFQVEDFSLTLPGIPESHPPERKHGNHRRLKSTPEASRDQFLSEVFSIRIPEAKEAMFGDENQHPFFEDKKQRPSLRDFKNTISSFRIGDKEKKPKSKILAHKRKMAILKDYDIMHDYQDTLRTKLPEVELGRVDGGWGLLFGNGETPYDQAITPTASWASGVTPSLFLQELAHLSSLCVAVALSSLRDNWYDPMIPMEPYIRGCPFPDVNTSKFFFQKKHSLSHKLRIYMVYWFGMEMADDYIRSYFHESSPLPVLGGVSFSEKAMLAQARGGAAKTTLAWYWLSEFITREQMNGAAGKVGGPILSRIHQFLSDGMIGYSTARNISYTPFPFSHAQISVFFIPVLVVFIPLLMVQYTNVTWLGTSLVFFTVTIFTAVQEVACELENPFKNFPNDIPLKTLLAMYNEALIQMCTGFHPDAQWEDKKKK